MKCAEHPNLDAVATCQGCGKGLCATCTGQFEQPLCHPCVVAHNRAVVADHDQAIREERRPVLWACAVFVLVAGWVMAANGVAGIKPGLVTGFLFAMLPAGWKFLGRFFDSGTGYQHAGARWVALPVHLMFSLLLGIVVGPFQIVRAVIRIKRLRREKQAIVATGLI